MVNSVTSRKFVSCTNCANQVQPEAKFCGECGSAIGGNYNQAPRIPAQVSYDDLAKLEAFRLAQIQGAQSQWRPTPTGSAAPPATKSGPAQAGAALNFASLGTKTRRVSKALINEMHFLQASLIRERAFLMMHVCIYIVANCFGLYLAQMCYHGYHGGDEVTKMLMALTPLTFINAVALSCFAPINGTRREINRIKERMQHVKVQMEIGDMF
jgi:hypothetical protein